jgi:hypothetical protein
MEAPKTPITIGEAATVFGTLTCPLPANAAGQTITVYRRATGTHGLLVAGSTTTEPSGAYQVTLAAFSANSSVYAATATVRSVRKAIKVAPAVSLSGPAGSALLTGYTGRRLALNRVIFSGSVSPADAGNVVVLQRENATSNEEWRRIGLGVVNGKGEYSIAHTFTEPGDANIRVVVRAQRHVDAAASTALSYVINQVQNPALTINSSAEPSPYGQPVTISGILAAGAGKSVALLAHGPRAKYAQVATATTETGGAYKFTLTPSQSTYYRVTSTGTKSAQLFQGVHYVLTPGPTADTAAVGQPLSFSGTVSPAQVGAPVYLERQYPNGIGFHVVETTTVGAGGSFTLVRAFYASGPFRGRIKVPGNPGYQGVAGPLFEIGLTPSLASALTPFTAAKLPNEGQL